MTNQEIVDYVMRTPGNTNPIILSQKLDELKNGYDAIINFSRTGECSFEKGDYSTLLKLSINNIMPKVLFKEHVEYSDYTTYNSFMAYCVNLEVKEDEVPSINIKALQDLYVRDITINSDNNISKTTHYLSTAPG